MSPTVGCFTPSGATITNIAGNTITFSPGAGCSGNFQMNVSSTPLNSSFLNGANGAEFDGAVTFNRTGWSVAAGDVNGDGIADLIIGAPASNASNGSVFVVFGKKSGWSGTPTVLNSAFLNGTNGVEFDGVAYQAGSSVAAGDLNGDGIADLIINAPMGGTSIYVVFGKKSGWSGTATLLNTAFLNGTNGVEFDGASSNGGNQSLTTGDINGDGIGDLIIGAPDAAPGGIVQAGSVYVVFGKKHGWPTSPYNLGGL